jgi:hypothetical protein
MRTARVGRLDDPVWSRPPTPVEIRELFRRKEVDRRAWRRLLWVLGALSVTVGSVALWIWANNLWPLGSGDPGGKTAGEILALRAVLPPGSTSVTTEANEPVWIGSCDDEFLKKGWSSLSAWINFNSPWPEEKTQEYIDRQMSERGWRYGSQGAADGPLGWQKTLATGLGSVQLTSGPGRSWQLEGVAPPAPPVGLCGGG